MAEKTKQLGVVQAILGRFNTQRLPRMLSLLEHVNRGEMLSDLDLGFLAKVAEDVNRNRQVSGHPDLQGLLSRLVDLFSEIAEKAVANEKRDVATL